MVKRLILAALALLLSGCATTNCYTYVYRSAVHPIFNGYARECPASADASKALGAGE